MFGHRWRILVVVVPILNGRCPVTDWAKDSLDPLQSNSCLRSSWQRWLTMTITIRTNERYENNSWMNNNNTHHTILFPLFFNACQISITCNGRYNGSSSSSKEELDEWMDDLWWCTQLIAWLTVVVVVVVVELVEDEAATFLLRHSHSHRHSELPQHTHVERGKEFTQGQTGFFCFSLLIVWRAAG